ncbi:hypothetical protein [Acinetobacter pullicarnis]|uniref:hypothetical protein n=1 Tax=Acinetobacter pullicarnis TaxID=2576829 RepID=UPI00111DE199|nr:hypothetical protein [Acinetobacter pullicarnis]
MNTPLLTPQDAFNAMLAGKNILCRAVGELMDFDDIEQFPATIFAKTGYEFCIKIETMALAGITFTKPLTLEEIQDEQDVYVIQPHDSIYHYKYRRTAALDTAIERGFAQRDVENAKLQFKALCIALGRNAGTESLVVPVGTNHEKPKATRKTKAPVVANKNVQIAASNDAVEKTSQSSIQITAVDKTVIQEDNLVTFDDAKNQLSHEKSLRDRITAALTIGDLEALLPELQQLHGESGHLIMSQYENHKESLSISELRRLTLEVEADLSAPVDEEEIKRLEILDDLLARAAIAKTPVEANALVTYTRSWTEEQRKPLLVAINKRLIELAPADVEAPPTLMDRIKSAVDLTTLDVLEVDVGARSPEMQPKFMAEIVKRRRVLEGEVA